MNRIIFKVQHIVFCLILYQQQQQQLEAFSFSATAATTPHGRFSSLHAATARDVPDTKRRQTCQTIVTIIASSLLVNAPAQASAAITTDNILESRVKDNVQTPPSYGLEGNDVYYPSWFEGKWKIQSACTSVEAPCGIALFGGNRTWATAQQELKDPPLVYEARFLRVNDNNQNVADREFNVRSIAQAVMGPQSVLDIPLATPNKLTCILVPTGAPAPFQVDLITLLRKQETPTTNQFDCSEVSREIITTTTTTTTTTTGSSSSTRPTTVLKEIETISLYSFDPMTQQIQCRQRSAKFLLPSQQDPMALRMWQMTGGRPVDVRYYTVSYKRD